MCGAMITLRNSAFTYTIQFSQNFQTELATRLVRDIFINRLTAYICDPILENQS